MGHSGAVVCIMKRAVYTLKRALYALKKSRMYIEKSVIFVEKTYLIFSHPRIYSDILTWLCVCQNIFRTLSDLRAIIAYSDISYILWRTCILTYSYIFWIHSDLRTICIQNIFSWHTWLIHVYVCDTHDSSMYILAYSDILLYILPYAYNLNIYILTYWHGYCQKSPVSWDTETHGWVVCVTHIHGWVMCVTRIYMDE